MRPRKFVLFAPLLLAGFAAFVAVGGWIVMLLWNWLLPAVFGIREITWWQALGILALSRILFGGFGMGGHRGGRWRGKRHWRELTPEERERWREKMHERWGGDEPSGQSQTI